MFGALTRVLSLPTESSWGALVSSITPNSRPARGGVHVLLIVYMSLHTECDSTVLLHCAMLTLNLLVVSFVLS